MELVKVTKGNRLAGKDGVEVEKDGRTVENDKVDRSVVDIVKVAKKDRVGGKDRAEVMMDVKKVAAIEVQVVRIEAKAKKDKVQAVIDAVQARRDGPIVGEKKVSLGMSRTMTFLVVDSMVLLLASR